MTVTAIACPACSASVPYGRLSCPACGELLASVAGIARRPVAWPAAPATSDTQTDAGPAEAPAADAVDPSPSAEPADASATEWPTTTEPAGAISAPSPGVVAPALAGPGEEPVWVEPATEEAHAPASGGPAPMSRPPAVPAWLHKASGGLTEPDADDEIPLLEPEPEAYPARPAWNAAPAPAMPPTPVGVPVQPPPTLDLPPSAVAAFTAATPIAPSGVHPPGSPFAAAGAAAAAPVSTPARAPRSWPTFRVGDLPEQLVVAGGGVAAVSFALPWGGTMIGAPSLGQPWISLGIMGSWHILALLAVLGSVALAARGTRVGPWLRIGVVPLLVSGDLFGLAWPYLTTSLGRGVGVYAVLVGAIAMGVGATLALRAASRPASPRNADPSSSV